MTVGWRAGEYTLLAKRRADAIAESWIAEHPRYGRVELWLVLPSIFAHAELRQEVEQVIAERARWNHRSIPAVIESFLAPHPIGQQTFAVATEYVRGVRCDQLMRIVGRLPHWIAARIVERIARTIGEAGMSPNGVAGTFDSLVPIWFDEQGAVHILPALQPLPNIQVVARELRMPPERFGFMSPELITAGVHPLIEQSTVFLLGILLFSLITGRGPFDRDSAFGTLEAIYRGEHSPISELVEVPVALEEIVERALSRATTDRHPDAISLANALDAVIPSDVGEREIGRLVARHLVPDPEPESIAEQEPEPELPLLAEIRADPEQPEPYLVYADHLLSKGDPRGELIAACHRGLRELQADLLRRHPELLGDLAPRMERLDRKRLINPVACDHYIGMLSYGPLSAEWHLGFIKSLRIANEGDTDELAQILREIAREESTRFLRALSIGPRDGEPIDFDPIYFFLATAQFQLKSLFVGDLASGPPRSVHRSTAFLCAAFPKLERLAIRGAEIRIEPLAFPELRELTIYTPTVTEELRSAIYRSALPKLEKLDLRAGMP